MQNRQVKKSITALSLILGVSTLMVSVNSVAEQKVKPSLTAEDPIKKYPLVPKSQSISYEEPPRKTIIENINLRKVDIGTLDRRIEDIKDAEALRALLKNLEQLLIPQTKTVQGEMWIGQDKRVPKDLFKQINDDAKSRVAKLDAEYAPKFKAAAQDSNKSKSKELRQDYDHRRKQIYNRAVELVVAAINGETLYTQNLKFFLQESSSHAPSKHASSKGLNPTDGPAGKQTSKTTKPKHDSLLPKSIKELPPMSIFDGALESNRSFLDHESTK